jgi:type III secretion system (T3SS) SseB-like protein
VSWFKRSSPKHPQEIRVPKVRFLGPQDGPAEQLLKDRLSEFFKRDRSVLAAYLARVDIGGQTSVALCLKTEFGPDRGRAEKVGAIFKTIFNAEVHLDIMFPNVTQQAELGQVCKPFFEAVPARLRLLPQETDLVGQWVVENGQVRGDAICERIEWLTTHYLRKTAASKVSGGKDSLFQDPDDGRF